MFRPCLFMCVSVCAHACEYVCVYAYKCPHCASLCLLFVYVRTHAHLHLCVCMCVFVTWGHVSAFRLHLLSPPLLLLFFFFVVGEERSVAPVQAASIHRLSVPFLPLPSLLCLSLPLLLYYSPLFTLSTPLLLDERCTLHLVSSPLIELS